MKLRKHLEKLRRIKRRKFHPLTHNIHKKHNISKKTLLYVKEYGQHSNVPKTIIKESIKILLFASLLSSLGGFSIEYIKKIFISVMPLIILLPVLNDMVGNYGTIISSRFTTMLYKNEANRRKLIKDEELKTLFFQILIISSIMAIFAIFSALLISFFQNYKLDLSVVYKVFLIGMIDVTLLVIILFFLVIPVGFYFYKRGEDPDNYLIPITTSIADFGNMLLLTLLVIIFF